MVMYTTCLWSTPDNLFVVKVFHSDGSELLPEPVSDSRLLVVEKGAHLKN